MLGGATFGLSDLIGGLVQGFKTNKAKNEFINTIKGSIKNYQDLGIPEHSPHKDTLIQDLNQELLDLTQTRSIPEDGGPDDYFIAGCLIDFKIQYGPNKGERGVSPKWGCRTCYNRVAEDNDE